tara:strand:+ start:341 stop:568 length:228 start_codon:yes stop_codon:yes gene_type:complete
VTIFNSIVLFLIIWWLILFIFLPIDISKQKKIELGNDPGAPENPKLKKKFVLTTFLTTIIWVISIFILKVFIYET